MDDERVLSKFLSSLKSKWFLIILAVAGIFLVIWGGRLTGNRTAVASGTEAPTADADAYRASLEQELTALCRKVKGAGEVQVMLTLSDGQTTTYVSGKQTSSEMPRVRGVAVLCKGGDDPAVRAEIVRLVSAVLGIGTHRIYVGVLE